MPLFHYVALRGSGKRSRGVIEADTLEDAKEKLRKQSIMAVEIARQGERREIFLSQEMLAAFTRDLGQLLNAGLPLYESLETIEEKYRSHKAHPLLLDLCDTLKGGNSLSFALKRYPRTFDAVYLSMVAAGEQSGALGRALEELSQLITRQSRLKKQLSSALIYPAFLSVFCLVVVATLLFFVIPSMQELFEGRALHPLTRGVLSVSAFANAHAAGISILFGASIIGAVLLVRSKQGKAVLQGFLLKLPFFKTLTVQTAISRFSRSLSLLLFGGVPLVEALSLSRKTMRHMHLERVVENAEKQIVEGALLSQQFKASPLIPSLVARMLAIAEETGRMAPMMQNVADIYDEEIERSLQQVTTLLQPLLLVVLGGVVGVVLLSILLPLTDVSSFLQ